MTWRELWLFLHVTAAMVWIGGAVAIQVFGILTKRAADPAKSAFFASNVSFTVSRILFPAALVVLLSGIGLKVEGHWDWSEPFIVYGLVFWALVSAVAFGYLGGAIGRAGMQLASEGPSPALALRMRNLTWLARGLLVVLLTIVFMMTTKLGT
jgi:hypothetical protein